MNNPVRMVGDTLQNLVSGLGVWGKDKSASRAFSLHVMDRREIEAAYRGDWIARNIINIPAFDMTRAWRTPQIPKAKLTAFAEEERRLGVRAKVKKAIWWARLFGGSGLVMDDGAADLMTPLRVTGKGGLKALLIFPRHQLTAGNLSRDPYDREDGIEFGQPLWFNMSGGERGSVMVHPSRVITFMGAELPDPQTAGADGAVYGDSVLMAVRDAVMAASATNQSLSSLVDEAKTDVITVNGLLGAIMGEEYRNNLLRRWELAAVLKSIHNVTLLDGNEKWETKQVNFAGLPDVAMTLLQVVAAAGEVPATKFLSQSPKGMNATGESDLQNYEQMIAARQDNDVTPRLDRLDEVLYVSALGAKPEGAYSQWNPLRIPTPKEASEIATAEATEARTIADSGLVPTAALEVSFQNRLIESGRWPGLEKAIEDAKKGVLLPFEDPADEGNDIDPKTGEPYPDDDPRSPIAKAANENEGPREIQVEGGKVAIKAKVQKPKRDAIVQDAKPRTLYVSRQLLNAAEVVEWAKAQGFEDVIAPEDMHVTVAFSRQPLDWMKVPADWWSDDRETGTLRVPPGGPRLVERLGNEGAVVLLFSSSALTYRHGEILGAGGSWDFDEYQPHVTLTYRAPAGLDLKKVKPFEGRLRFGPERFEEVVEDWRKDVVEA